MPDLPLAALLLTPLSCYAYAMPLRHFSSLIFASLDYAIVAYACHYFRRLIYFRAFLLVTLMMSRHNIVSIDIQD